LSIVETLKEFRNILLGQKIIVYTDHQNLIHKTFNSERVMRWRLLLEEYGPEIKYLKGSKNIVADALSRLNIQNDNNVIDSTDKLIQSNCTLFATEISNDIFPLQLKSIMREQQKDKEFLKMIKIFHMSV
jgi:hypothetical protein